MLHKYIKFLTSFEFAFGLTINFNELVVIWLGGNGIGQLIISNYLNCQIGEMVTPESKN